MIKCGPINLFSLFSWSSVLERRELAEIEKERDLLEIGVYEIISAQRSAERLRESIRQKEFIYFCRNGSYPE